MVDYEMFLQLKLTFKNHRIKIIFAIAIVIPATVIILGTSAWDSCGIQHITILNDIQKYEQTLDPEFCESIVYRIDDFNDICEPEIEILDCG